MDDAIPSQLTTVDYTRIPSIPQLVLDLIAVCRRPDFDPAQAASIIRSDPNLCRLFLLCRNPSDAAEPLDLERQIREMDRGVIKSVAMHAAAAQLFAAPELSARALRTGFWTRSISCALYARALARQVDQGAPDEAHLAGLFHGIGDPFARTPAADAVESAAVLVESWGLRPTLADAIRYQMEPAERVLDAHPLVRLLNIARRLTDTGPAHTDGDYESAQRILGVSSTTLYDLRERTEAEIHALFDRIGLCESHGDGAPDQDRQLELARQVRDFSRLSAVARDLAGAKDVSELLAALDRQICLLFELGPCRIFRFAPSLGLLHCVGNRDTEFRIGVAPGRSLLAEALLQRRPLHTLHAEPSGVVDRQLVRLLGGKAMLCIPLLDGGVRVGVLVAGFDPARPDPLEHRKDLLHDFAELAAVSLERMRPPPTVPQAR